MKEILKKLQEIISERTGVEKSDIKPDAFFMEDLNVDEMEIGEIVTALEEAMDVELDIDLTEIKTVGDLIQAVADEIE